LRSAINEQKKWIDSKVDEFVEVYIHRYFVLKDFWIYANSKDI